MEMVFTRSLPFRRFRWNGNAAFCPTLPRPLVFPSSLQAAVWAGWAICGANCLDQQKTQSTQPGFADTVGEYRLLHEGYYCHFIISFPRGKNILCPQFLQRGSSSSIPPGRSRSRFPQYRQAYSHRPSNVICSIGSAGRALSRVRRMDLPPLGTTFLSGMRLFL